jgi:hypothetical protein
MGMLLIKRWAGRLARLLVYSSCSTRSRGIRIIPERKLFSSAVDARKRPAKCAVAHELADDR